MNYSTSETKIEELEEEANEECGDGIESEVPR